MPIDALALLLWVMSAGAIATPVPVTQPSSFVVNAQESDVDARVAFFAIGTRTAHFPVVSGSVTLEGTSAEGVTGQHLLLDVLLDARHLRAGDSLTESRLRGPGFFDVDHYPTVRFRGNTLMMISPLDGRIDGTLTARGVTRPITLAVHFSRPPAQRAAAGASMTLTATARIDRNDYGMRAYPLIVGSRVTVTINAQLTPA